LGTNAENTADRHAKGRSASGDSSGRYTKPDRNARGERNGKSKLTEAVVAEIRAKVAAGASLGTVAKEHGVYKSTISRVIRRQTWA
jgi:hypothetical protein